MIPITVVAHLASAPIGRHPYRLDSMLYAGIGYRLGREHPSGWADEAEVFAQPLPLARVEVGDAWWWAASAVPLAGGESRVMRNRRPSYELARDWTGRGSLNHGCGPDKGLRIPEYRRIDMRTLTWTCIGDLDAVRGLVNELSHVGPLGAHGYGRVDHWEVSEGGPDLDAYTDPRVRHVPAGLVRDPGGLRFAQLALRPPYHDKRDAVSVAYVHEVAP